MADRQKKDGLVHLAMLIAYNTKCKTKLAMRKLYGKEDDEAIEEPTEETDEAYVEE